jgi:hypothetical protein
MDDSRGWPVGPGGDRVGLLGRSRQIGFGQSQSEGPSRYSEPSATKTRSETSDGSGPLLCFVTEVLSSGAGGVFEQSVVESHAVNSDHQRGVVGAHILAFGLDILA